MSHFKALTIVIFGITLMSIESLLIKISSVNAYTFSFYVCIGLFISTNVYLFYKYKSSYFFVFKQSFFMLLISAIFLTASNLFFIMSIKNTTIANATLIFATAPIFSAFYMYLFFKVKSKKTLYVSTVFIFLGLIIIFIDGISSNGGLGNIYALLCVIFYSLSFVLLGRYPNLDVYALFALAGLFGTINSYFLSSTIEISSIDLKIVLITGLIIVPLARILVGKGVKVLEASEVSLLMVLETILAPLFAWLFLTEIPSTNTFIGGFIILTTLIINSILLLKNK